VYGSPTETGDGSGNRAGRVKTVTWEGGSEERFYDRLGNVREARTTLGHMAQPTRPNVTFKMKYAFDSLGRMLDMTFPNWIDGNFQFVAGDGEKVTYTYDRGGNLDKIDGHHITPNPQQTSHPRDFEYVRHIGYDEFGQRTVLTSGNGIANQYRYDALTRRLTDIDASARGDLEVQQNRPAAPFHKLRYAYDAVGNITTLNNAVSIQPWRNASVNVGPSRISYVYDNLYQLVQTSAIYRSRRHEGYQWSDGFTYDEIGNFKRKAQTLDRLVWDNQNVTYTTNPTEALNQLNGSRFDHTEVAATYTLDYQYTGPRPHAASRIVETRPGSAAQTRTFTYDADGSNTGNTFQGTTRVQVWDEEDRLKEVRVGSATVAKFRYSDEGERTKKQAVQLISQNGDSWYVNQFYNVMAGVRPTKHIFAGETRVASKTDAIWMQTPVTHHYHPDHVGTTSYVSDARQNLVQHERYFAFGELWRGGGPQEETDLSRPNGDRKEWLFTSKEFDVETGLYYFGARYLDPRTGVWQSTDPILRSYMVREPDLGAPLPANLGLYSYSFNNPMALQDPDGRAPQVAAVAFGAVAGAGAAVGAAIAVCAASVVCLVASAALVASYVHRNIGPEIPAQITHVPPVLPVPGIPPSQARPFREVGSIPVAVASAAVSSKSASRVEPRAIDKAIPQEQDKEQFVVRLQAQGGGLEKSVPFNQPFPVTADQALAGLDDLATQLTPRQMSQRDQAFSKAAAFIRSAAAAGGVGPMARSFTNRGVRGKNARVDVEVLRGINLTKTPGRP
jgi:RHS repeat-associated protein